jgi:hypothetical protein
MFDLSPPKKVLIGCEYSGVVRDAFRALGHDAFSCDLLPSDTQSPYHIQGCIYDALELAEWDFIGLHPPCTSLCVSGNSTYGKGMPKHAQRLDSIEWTRDLWEYVKTKAPMAYLENPIGVLGGALGKPSYIQPFEHGHLETKKTCLWLHGLEALEPTNNVFEAMMQLPRKERMRMHYLPPSKDRWKIRSTTYKGIALAMAKQWGGANYFHTINDLVGCE